MSHTYLRLVQELRAEDLPARLRAQGLSLSREGKRATCELSRSLSVQVQCTQERYVQAMERLFQREVQTGDERFDQRVRLYSDTPEELRSFLAAPAVRDAIFTVIDAGGEVALQETRLTARLEEEHEPAFWLLVAAALAFEDTRAERAVPVPSSPQEEPAKSTTPPALAPRFTAEQPYAARVASLRGTSALAFLAREELRAQRGEYKRPRSTNVGGFSAGEVWSGVREVWRLPENARLQVQLTQEGLFDALKKLFSKELQTGDARFDKRVYIHTETPEQTQRFLSAPELRAAVFAIIDAGGEIEIDNQRLELTHGPDHAEDAALVVAAVLALTSAPR